MQNRISDFGCRISGELAAERISDFRCRISGELAALARSYVGHRSAGIRHPKSEIFVIGD